MDEVLGGEQMTEASDVFAIDVMKGIGWVRALAVGVLSGILMFSITYLVRKIDGGIAPLVIFPLVALIVGYGAVRYGRLPFRWILGVAALNSVIMALVLTFMTKSELTSSQSFSAVQIRILRYFIFQGLPYVVGGLIGRKVSQRQLRVPVNVAD